MCCQWLNAMRSLISFWFGMENAISMFIPARGFGSSLYSCVAHNHRAMYDVCRRCVSLRFAIVVIAMSHVIWLSERDNCMTHHQSTTNQINTLICVRVWCVRVETWVARVRCRPFGVVIDIVVVATAADVRMWWSPPPSFVHSFRWWTELFATFHSCTVRTPFVCFASFSLLLLHCAVNVYINRDNRIHNVVQLCLCADGLCSYYYILQLPLPLLLQYVPTFVYVHHLLRQTLDSHRRSATRFCTADVVLASALLSLFLTPHTSTFTPPPPLYLSSAPPNTLTAWPFPALQWHSFLFHLLTLAALLAQMVRA